MTEEEIRPIAENYVEEYCHCSDGEYTDGSLVCAGIGTALIVSRQLEKRIAELEEAKANLEYLLEGRDNEIDELKKENKVLAQNLEDTEICENGWKNRVKELEAQIKKMRCCGNCKNEGDYKEPYRYGTGWCNICKRHKVAKGNFDKWEIKEK